MNYRRYWLPDEVVAAVGHVTIAAGELELILAMIGAIHTDGDAFRILAKPGEPLRAARHSAESTVSPYKEAFLSGIDSAAELLMRRHTVVHAMWVNDGLDQASENWELLHYKTKIRHPADPIALNDLAQQLMVARNLLVRVLTNKINSRPPFATVTRSQELPSHSMP